MLIPCDEVNILNTFRVMIILRLLLLLTNLHLKLLSTQGTAADKLLSTQRVNYSEIKKNIIESNRMKSNRIASIIIESNRELGESFQAYIPYLPFTKRSALRCTISNLSELYFWWGCQTVALYFRKDRTRVK